MGIESELGSTCGRVSSEKIIIIFNAHSGWHIHKLHAKEQNKIVQHAVRRSKTRAIAVNGLISLHFLFTSFYSDCWVNSRRYYWSYWRSLDFLFRLTWEPTSGFRCVSTNQKGRSDRTWLLSCVGREGRRTYTWLPPAGWDSKCGRTVCLVSSRFIPICGGEKLRSFISLDPRL